MTDVVVTVPKGLWFDWIAEGDAVGEKPTGLEWGFFMGGPPPLIEPGERVYVVSHGRVRGYAPLTRLVKTNRGYAFCRGAGAVAVTISYVIPGFRGWRKRWWDLALERPFPDWMTEDVKPETEAQRQSLARLQTQARKVG